MINFKSFAIKCLVVVSLVTSERANGMPFEDTDFDEFSPITNNFNGQQNMMMAVNHDKSLTSSMPAMASDSISVGLEQELGFLVGSHRSQLAPLGKSRPDGLGAQQRLVRRQVSYPSLPGQNEPQPGLFMPPMQPVQQQQPSLQQQQQQSGVFKFFSDLGPQIERAKTISSLFSSTSSLNNNGTSSAGSQFNPAQLMMQLSDLIKSTQDRNAKLLESTERSADQLGQQTASAAKQAQGGIQSALAEIGLGLQRMAANNPNLLPDIKNLYQSVATKLSSASSSVAQAAAPQKNGAEQFAEQLAKAGQA